MSDIIPLEGRAGVLHVSSHWVERYNGSNGPRRFDDLGVLSDRFLRIVEIDGVFYVGHAGPMLMYRAQRAEQVLHVVASFDTLDAALMCYRTEAEQ